MLQHRAEVNLLDKDNWSPLLFAARNNKKDAVVQLLNAGADPRLGDSPLTDFRERKNIKEIIRDLGTAAEASKRSQQADVGG